MLKLRSELWQEIYIEQLKTRWESRFDRGRGNEKNAKFYAQFFLNIESGDSGDLVEIRGNYSFRIFDGFVRFCVFDVFGGHVTFSRRIIPKALGHALYFCIVSYDSDAGRYDTTDESDLIN